MSTQTQQLDRATAQKLIIRKQLKNDDVDIEVKRHEMERNKWKSRRKMSWVALVSMIVVTLIVLLGPVSDQRLKILSEVITWFYFTMTSIIGAYMGFTTMAAIKGLKGTGDGTKK